MGKYSENGGENDTENYDWESEAQRFKNATSTTGCWTFFFDIFAKCVPQVSQFFRIISAF